MEGAKSYRKRGVSYARRVTDADVRSGLTSPITRPSTALPKKVLCMGGEGYQPLHKKQYICMGDPSNPDKVEYWTNMPDFIEANKEPTGVSINFDGHTWQQYRNKTVVLATFVEVPFILIDQDDQEFNINEPYWVIFNNNGPKPSLYPCKPDKFVYDEDK